LSYFGKNVFNVIVNFVVFFFGNPLVLSIIISSLRDFVADDYRKNRIVLTIIPKGWYDYRKNQGVSQTNMTKLAITLNTILPKYDKI
jgi:hypothetical protein